MTLPKLVSHKSKVYSTTEFKGIVQNGEAKENQFYDSCNITSEKYPRASSRNVRYKLDEINIGDNGFVGYFENNGIKILSEGNSFEYTIGSSTDDSYTTLDFTGDICNANTVNYNKNTVIMYDGKGYEFESDGSISKTDVKYTVSYARENDAYSATRNTMYLSVLYEDGTAPSGYSKAAVSDDFPSGVAVDHCYSKNGTLYRLMRYGGVRGDEQEWEIVSNFVFKLRINAANNLFRDNDYIKISGIKYWNWAVRSLSVLNGFFRIKRGANNNEIITDAVPSSLELASFISSITYPTNDIFGYDSPIINNSGNLQPILEGELENILPSVNFICATGNRVWGCSKFKNEISASELGNARSWNCYEGLSSDSYTVSIGSKGRFTSCCCYQGKPIFFKEEEMIIISGSRPSSYTVNSYSCKGVTKDSPDGICIMNDVLYYKAYDGIYAYAGGNPVCISKDITNSMIKLKKVRMCAQNGYLYVYGIEDSSARLYVYDSTNRIWQKCSPDNTVGLLSYFDGAIQLCKNGEKIEVYSINSQIPGEFSSAANGKQELSWYWETPKISYNTAERKYISSLAFELECESGCEVQIKYDNERKYKRIKKIPPIKRRGVRIPIFPKPCYHFSIRMQGKGEMTLYGVFKTVEEG